MRDHDRDVARTDALFADIDSYLDTLAQEHLLEAAHAAFLTSWPEHARVRERLAVAGACPASARDIADRMRAGGTAAEVSAADLVEAMTEMPRG